MGETAPKTSATQDDLRRTRRLRTLKSAKLIFNNEQSVLDCVIRDISATGARLFLGVPWPAPKVFNLLIAGEKAAVPCQLIWQRGMDIGVWFGRA